MSSSKEEMEIKLTELQKKLSDLEISSQMNFAIQELEMQNLKNQINKEKDREDDKEASSSRSRQPLREISVPQSTNSLSPLAGSTRRRPSRWGPRVEEVEISPTPVLNLPPLISTFNLQPLLSPSSPTIIIPPNRGRPSIPVNKPAPNHVPSPSPRAFPRLAVSSKSRGARGRPRQASPRHTVKCPMCQKVVKKPMRLQQCPQVCFHLRFKGNFRGLL